MFVTFEGGEGSGKTSLLRRLAQQLRAQGRDVLETREPGGSPLGEEVRGLLLRRSGEMPIEQRAELLLFLAARAQNVEQLIKPALAAGRIILCDRFNDSSVAYQGVARGLGLEKVQALCDAACNGLEPGLTLYLDVSPELGLQRSQATSKAEAAKGQLDRIEAEALSFHESVRQGFLEQAKRHPERIVTIDASQDQESVFNEAWRIVQGRL